MKIYVAGTYASKLDLRPIRDKIWSLGHEITSSWLDEVSKPASMSADDFRKKLAIKDLCEVASADILIVDADKMSGGKHVELGFAIGRFQKQLIWFVGNPSNIFYELADGRFRDWNECIKYLEANFHSSVSVDANLLKT